MRDPNEIFEREHDELARRRNSGEITDAEFRAEERDLIQAHRDEADAAAREAYDRELDRWW